MIKKGIIYIFLTLTTINSLIVIPFKAFCPNYDFNSINLTDLYNYTLYTNISLGNPTQIINSMIRLDKAGLSIPSSTNISSNSKTYTTYNNMKSYIIDEKYTALFSFDEFNFISINTEEYKSSNYKNKIKNYKNISFVIREKETLPNDYGIIGLSFPRFSGTYVDMMHLIPTLKNQNVTDNLYWTIKYNTKLDIDNQINLDFYKNIEGDLIIGGDSNNKYSKDYFREINVAKRGNELAWDLPFNKIIVGDFEISDYAKQAALRPDLMFNYATLTYKIKIDSLFFKPLLDSEICTEIHVNQYKFDYYMCDASKTGPRDIKFVLEKFPEIKFYVSDFNYTFIMSYKDLFLQDINNKNIYYFLFLFDRDVLYVRDKNGFHLGMRFWAKYQFLFDLDKKTIGFYEKLVVDEKKLNVSFQTVIMIFLVIILIIIFIVFGILVYKGKIQFSRKKRANELSEDFDYNTKINEDS